MGENDGNISLFFPLHTNTNTQISIIEVNFQVKNFIQHPKFKHLRKMERTRKSEQTSCLIIILLNWWKISRVKKRNQIKIITVESDFHCHGPEMNEWESSGWEWKGKRYAKIGHLKITLKREEKHKKKKTF